MGFVVILIILGVLLLLAEILLVPGVGVAGIFGLLSLIGSCVYSFYVFGSGVGTVIIAINVVLVVGLTIYVLREKTWKRFSLTTKIDNSVASETEPLAIGDVGRTTTRLAPMGSARFESGLYEVKALEGMMDAGTEVEVVLIEDNKIIVGPVDKFLNEPE